MLHVNPLRLIRPADIPCAAVSEGGAAVAPTITDNGDGSLTISAGYFVLYSSTTHAPPDAYYVTGGTYTFVDQSINYLYVNYNAGAPVIVNSTDRSAINQLTGVPICTVYRNGTSLSVLDFDSQAIGKASKISDRLVRCRRFEAETGGLLLGESAGRVVTISAGTVWVSSINFTLDAFSSGNMVFYYHSSGNWTTSTITQYNNTQYDDGTDLQTLGPNKYTVNWVYREVTSGTARTFIILGSGNYFLSDAITAPVPTAPPEIQATAILVGRIIVERDATSAQQIDSAFETRFTSAGASAADITTRKPFHGVYSRDESTLSFTDLTRTFAITPTDTYFHIWYKGTEYTLTEQTVEVADTVGLHFIYFDSSGTLVESTSPWNILEDIPVATVFWNGTIGALSDERHGSDRDLEWHKWAHFTVGARYRSGLSFSNVDGTPDTFSVALGTIADEDIVFDIDTETTCRVWYQNGASTYIFGNTASNYAYLWNAGTGRAQYPNSASSYALTDFAANRFFNVWVYAATDLAEPIYVFTETFSGGTGGYTTVALARAVGVPDLSTIGISPELKLLYRVIYRGDGQWQEQTDYRNSASIPVGGVAVPTAASVSFTPSGTISATNVQAAIEEVAAEAIPSTSFAGLLAFAAAYG